MPSMTNKQKPKKQKLFFLYKEMDNKQNSNGGL